MYQKKYEQEAASKLSTVGKKYFKFIEFDENEVMMGEIRKHPIGLFFIYFTGIAIAIVMSIVFGLLIFHDGVMAMFEDSGISPEPVRAVATLLGMIILLGIFTIMTIQAILYVNNVIFVTSEKIAQVLYINLFNRKISQLSIGDVQDVTVSQKGVLAHIFNYGTLTIETAGEQQNYTFTYIPDPYTSSKLIVGAHERNLVEFGN